MKHVNYCKKLVFFISFSIISLCASAAPILSGSGYPAIGGNTASSSGSIASGSGRTITYSGFNPTQYANLYYAVGNYPGGIFSPDPSFYVGTSNTTNSLLFSAADSSLATGKVVWNGLINLSLASGSGFANYPTQARFTLQVTDTANNLLSLINPTSLGLNGELGGVLDVTGSFKANWLFEIKNPLNNSWGAANDVFNALSTNPATHTYSSVGGAFYYTPAVPVPAAAWLMGSGLVGLAGIARRRKQT